MKKNIKNDRGFTLFIAVIAMGTLLLIAMGVVSLAVRQSFIAVSGRESQHAFYAADTGLECALFWDVQNPSGTTAFSTTSDTVFVQCNKNIQNPGNEFPAGGNGITISYMNPILFLPDPYCAVVSIQKQTGGTTEIISRGYNTCDTTSPRRVERAIRANY